MLFNWFLFDFGKIRYWFLMFHEIPKTRNYFLWNPSEMKWKVLKSSGSMKLKPRVEVEERLAYLELVIIKFRAKKSKSQSSQSHFLLIFTLSCHSLPILFDIYFLSYLCSLFWCLDPCSDDEDITKTKLALVSYVQEFPVDY